MAESSLVRHRLCARAVVCPFSHLDHQRSERRTTRVQLAAFRILFFRHSRRPPFVAGASVHKNGLWKRRITAPHQHLERSKTLVKGVSFLSGRWVST